MRFHEDLCPCIRAQKSPTDGTIIELPDRDCAHCEGGGVAWFVEFDRPRLVRRADARGRLLEAMRARPGRIWTPRPTQTHRDHVHLPPDWEQRGR